MSNYILPTKDELKQAYMEAYTELKDKEKHIRHSVLYKRALNKIGKKYPPRVLNAARFVADTRTFTTNKGVRTTHYIDFDFEILQFTDNQEQKLAKMKAEKIVFAPDPWIGRKPSLSEATFVALMNMVLISELEPS